jgi:hypothetical protein
VSNDYRSREFQCVDDREDVVKKTVNGILRSRETRGPETPSRDAVNVEAGRELRSKVVEHVRGVPTPGKEDERPA